MASEASPRRWKRVNTQASPVKRGLEGAAPYSHPNRGLAACYDRTPSRVLSPSDSSPALPVTPFPLVNSRRWEARTLRVLLLVLLITVQVVLCIQVASRKKNTFHKKNTFLDYHFYFCFLRHFCFSWTLLASYIICCFKHFIFFFLIHLGTCLLHLDSVGVLIILLPQTVFCQTPDTNNILSNSRPNSGQIHSPSASCLFSSDFEPPSSRTRKSWLTVSCCQHSLSGGRDMSS